MSPEPERIELAPAEGVRFQPAEWERRAADVVRAVQEDEETPIEAAAEALRTLRLTDLRGATWFHDGTAWSVWDGAQWRAGGRPEGPLLLTPFVLEVVPEVDEQPPFGLPRLDDTPDPLPDDEDAPFAPPVPPVAAAQPAYRPGHVVPASGLPVWASPDGSTAPVATLDAGLDVMVVEQQPSGWARIVCSNGWGGWLDGRRLEPR